MTSAAGRPCRRCLVPAPRAGTAAARLSFLLTAWPAATLAVLLAGCGGSSQAAGPAPVGPSAHASTPAASPGPTLVGSTSRRQLVPSTPMAPRAEHRDTLPPDPSAGTPAPAQAGRPGPTQRRSFVPTAVRLAPAGSASRSAAVDRVDTGHDGQLSLPSDPGRVGWWVGGALAGDPYGSVVLAGHIDSRAWGIGFFARLLDARSGERVTLTGSGLQQAYRVVSTRSVGKSVLATGTDPFSATVPGRLVLITCTGRFDSSTHHYTDNLVVVAAPVGVPSAIR